MFSDRLLPIKLALKVDRLVDRIFKTISDENVFKINAR
jgi:hypothetical protein